MSCESSAGQTIHRTFQALFSIKRHQQTNQTIKMSSAAVVVSASRANRSVKDYYRLVNIVSLNHSGDPSNPLETYRDQVLVPVNDYLRGLLW